MCRITRQFQEGLNFDYVILWCQQVFCGLLSYLLVMHRNAEFHFFRENYSRLRFVCTMIFYLTLDIMDTFFPQFCWLDPQCDGGMNLLVRTLDSVVLRGFSVFFLTFSKKLVVVPFCFPFSIHGPIGLSSLVDSLHLLLIHSRDKQGLLPFFSFFGTIFTVSYSEQRKSMNYGFVARV